MCSAVLSFSYATGQYGVLVTVEVVSGYNMCLFSVIAAIASYNQCGARVYSVSSCVHPIIQTETMVMLFFLRGNIADPCMHAECN